MTPKVAIVTLILVAICGCGGSGTLSLAAIETRVASESLASLQHTEGLHLKASATCAEMPNVARTYDCRVQVRTPDGKTSPTQEVTAILSKDGKNVVVQGL